MGATVAAIANAFFDATGARLRQYPMTPRAGAGGAGRADLTLGRLRSVHRWSKHARVRKERARAP